jgi:hypothetical protein
MQKFRLIQGKSLGFIRRNPVVELELVFYVMFLLFRLLLNIFGFKGFCGENLFVKVLFHKKIKLILKPILNYYF